MKIRGSKFRADNPYCLFSTPQEIVDELFKYEPDLIYPKSKLPMFLEPCAGTGAILQAIKNWNPHAIINAVEIQEGLRENLIGLCGHLVIDNFLSDKVNFNGFDSIICNPPFSHTEHFIRKCYSLLHNRGIMAFLLPQIQLVSRCRHKLFNELIPRSIYFLCRRPSGDLAKINPTGYVWVVWEKDQKIKTTEAKWIYP